MTARAYATCFCEKKMNSSYLCIMGNLYCRQAVTATLTCSSKSFRSKKLALDVGVLITNTPAWLGSERELSFLYDREFKGSPLLLSMSKGNHQVIISSYRRFDHHSTSTSYLDEESTKCTIAFLEVSPPPQVVQSWMPVRSFIPPSARCIGGTPAIDRSSYNGLESSQHFTNGLSCYTYCAY